MGYVITQGYGGSRVIGQGYGSAPVSIDGDTLIVDLTPVTLRVSIDPTTLVADLTPTTVRVG